MGDLARRLRDGTSKVGVVGIGYIGFSTAAYFARQGVKVVGYDVSQERVDAFNAGDEYIENILYWIGFGFRSFVKSGIARATTSAQDLEGCDVVFVAIPTERNGDPYMDILEATVETLSRVLRPGTLVIVESTLTPGTADKVVVDGFAKSERGDLLVAVAARRDWFVDARHTMVDIPRIVGGATRYASDCAADVLSIVCESVIQARSHREAEMIKSVENAYRHMDITLANQLCFAYPDVNMREVLQLVGTKWNMNSYYPNLGVGGYCIAPASKYVMGGAQHPEELGLLRDASEFTEGMAARYATLVEHFDRVAILGIAYKGGLKVDILSPGGNLAAELSGRGVDVVINDPMYGVEELAGKVGVRAAPFPEVVDGATLVVIAADHVEYSVPSRDLMEWLLDGVTVLDVVGAWADLELPGVKYVRLGDAGWSDALSA